VRDPDFVELIVRKRDNREAIRAYPCFFESEPYHRDSFAGAKRVVECVTVLGAAHDNDQLIDSFKDMLHSLQVA
jgi:hypothetical protein